MEWASVLNNPFLQDLPFKIELNKWGKILMSPASNHHGMLQSEAVFFLRSKLSGGRVITECSIQTEDGVKVADVAWASDDFMQRNGIATPYQAGLFNSIKTCIKMLADLFRFPSLFPAMLFVALNQLFILPHFEFISLVQQFRERALSDQVIGGIVASCAEALQTGKPGRPPKTLPKGIKLRVKNR